MRRGLWVHVASHILEHCARFAEVSEIYGYIILISWAYTGSFISSIGAVIVVFGVVVIAIRKWIAALPEDDGMRKTLWFLLK